MLVKQLGTLFLQLQKPFAYTLLVACVFFATSHDSAEAALYKRLSTGAWKGGIYVSNKTGEFSHCAVSAKYKSGITLLFSVTRNLRWKVGFSKNTWEMTIGKTYPVRYQVDRRKIVDGKARAATKKMAVITLPGSSRLFNQMRRGRVLKVKAADDLLKFNLTGTNKMLSLLLRCARRNVNLVVNRPLASNDLGKKPKSSNPFAEKPSITQPAPPATRPTATKRAPQGAAPTRRAAIPQEHREEAANWLRKTLANSDILYKVVRNEGKARKLYKKYPLIWRVGSKPAIIGTLRIYAKANPERLANNVLANEARKCKGSFASRFMNKDDVGSKKITRLLTTCLKENGKQWNVYSALSRRDAGGAYLVMLTSSKASSNAVLQAGERMAGSMQMSRSVTSTITSDFSEDDLPPITDNNGKVVRY